MVELVQGSQAEPLTGWQTLQKRRCWPSLFQQTPGPLAAGGQGHEAVGTPGKNPTWGPREVGFEGMRWENPEVMPLKAEKRPERD